MPMLIDMIEMNSHIENKYRQCPKCEMVVANLFLGPNKLQHWFRRRVPAQVHTLHACQHSPEEWFSSLQYGDVWINTNQPNTSKARISNWTWKGESWNPSSDLELQTVPRLCLLEDIEYFRFSGSGDLLTEVKFLVGLTVLGWRGIRE